MTYTVNKRLKHRVFQGMHYEHYYKAYAHADICLVPLVNSRFNSMKSNLKILEAANLSLPVIAHNVEPYKNMPVLYAQGTQQWVKACKYYINNENARLDDGYKLNEFCNKFFNHRAINYARKEIFHEVREQTNIRCS
jgi:glycosyltransferase involved in cell wall biosynthesis